jgi:hypothetical protein
MGSGASIEMMIHVTNDELLIRLIIIQQKFTDACIIKKILT